MCKKKQEKSLHKLCKWLSGLEVAVYDVDQGIEIANRRLIDL